MKTISVTIKGLRPMLQHSERLLDPLDVYTRKIAMITSKPAKQKTDADIEEVSRLEFQGGLWYDDCAEHPIIPAEAIEACIRDGAKDERKGKQFTAAVTVTEINAPLVYKGPKKRDELWETIKDDERVFVDRRGVKLGAKKVMRTRPRFDEWSASFTLEYDEHTITRAEIQRAIIVAGAKKGIGDYRPRFGLFEVSKFK